MPSTTIPVTHAASIDPVALHSVEQAIANARNGMLDELNQLSIVASRMNGSIGSIRSVNRKLVMIQLRADALFSTFDLFQDAVALRADTELGKKLAGVDALLAQALARPIPGYTPPKAISYLDSTGRGGAIARARSRLGGGVRLGDAALVRVTPDSLLSNLRLSSAAHECGHQLNADFGLVEEGKRLAAAIGKRMTGSNTESLLLQTWVSESLADCWSVVLTGGAPAVDGLQRVLSLPREALYTIQPGRPHPPGVMRNAFVLAAARKTYPDPSLKELEKRFSETYLDARELERRPRFRGLLKVMSHLGGIMIQHPFAGLKGRSIAQSGAGLLVHPKRVARLLGSSRDIPVEKLLAVSPLEALAMLGFAKLRRRMPLPQQAELGAQWLIKLGEQRFREPSQPTVAKTTSSNSLNITTRITR